jgi:hypothetical protein
MSLTLSSSLPRGSVFGAQHDSSYDFWASGDPRWKLCVAFNAVPPAAADDVHYFIATSQVNYFRENPQLESEVLILAPGSYSFFPEETAIDFRDLRIVPRAKLNSKGLKILGSLSEDDVRKCEAIIRGTRLLENRSKRRLALLN